MMPLDICMALQASSIVCASVRAAFGVFMQKRRQYQKSLLCVYLVMDEDGPKREFKGLRRCENRSVQARMGIFESSVTRKAPF